MRPLGTFLDRWFAIDADQLHSNSQTSYRLLVAGRLWFGTFVVWAVCQIFTIQMQTELWWGWMAALVGLSGLDVVQFGKMRTTDYGAMDRQATIEAAKVSGPAAPAPTQITQTAPGATATAVNTAPPAGGV